MKIQLCDLLASEGIPSSSIKDEATLQSLADQFNASNDKGDESCLWEIYIYLCLHKQALAGDADAEHALLQLRLKTSQSLTIKKKQKEKTRKHWGKFLGALPPSWKGVQNQTNYMRQIFYPEWMIENDSDCCYPVLCFEPHGEKRLEALIERVIREEVSQPDVDVESPELGDDLEPLIRHGEVLAQEFMAACKAKLAAGTGLNKPEQRRFCGCFDGKINALVFFDEAGRRAGMGGLRACTEKCLSNEPLEPYPFTDAAWVGGLLVEATKPVDVDDEQSRRITASIADIQEKFESGEYEFEISPCPDESLSQCLNGVDAALCPVFFRYVHAGRHENAGGRLFSLLAEALPEPGIVAWPILIAYATARMDLQKHLLPVLRANAGKMDSLAPWIMIELVQAGRLEEAVDLVTGKGASEALSTGDKVAFDRANCMVSALKSEREYTYSGIFNYLCARLPELLPEEAARERALESLEKTALADPFWEDPNLHQAESLIALAGTMLRCGELNRASNLMKRLFEKHRVLKSAEWVPVQAAFLDAACFWYLKGNVNQMTAILRSYLKMRWCDDCPM